MPNYIWTHVDKNSFLPQWIYKKTIW
uniref:Uncharacterized protein n=1 Tax=Anguilla anguilla TaxID=7936 RepID=A0A0E9SN55_ANGAN